MKCDMQPYGPCDAHGRQRFQCSRKSCERYAGWVKRNKRKVSSPDCDAGEFLGDRLAKFLSRRGIKKKGCGSCGNRQEALNRWSYSCTNAVGQTWRIVVGIPHDLIARLLLRMAGLLVWVAGIAAKVYSKLLPRRRKC